MPDCDLDASWEALMAGDDLPGAATIWEHKQRGLIVILSMAISPEDGRHLVVFKCNRSGMTLVVPLADWRGDYERVLR